MRYCFFCGKDIKDKKDAVEILTPAQDDIVLACIRHPGVKKASDEFNKWNDSNKT